MSGIDLSVQRLRLEVPRDMSAHALRPRVEDGLRIASMPTSLAHRFVLLRRLRLVLPRETSAQSLALQLEREWRAIESLAQPMSGAAADAPAVWAAHEAEARVLLLQRWLDGRDSGAWFWQQLLPTAHEAMPLAQRLRALMFEPFDTAPAHAATASGQRRELWREALPRVMAAGQLAALMAGLTAAERNALVAVLPAALLGGPSALQARRAAPQASALSGGRSPAAPIPRERPVHGTRVGSRLFDAIDAGVEVTPAAAPDGSKHGAAAEPAALLRAGWSLAPAAESDGGRETAWAGLWFLLPLLLRQGLAQRPVPASMFEAILQVAQACHGLDATARAWGELVAQQAGLNEAAKSALRPEAEVLWRLAREVSVRQARLPLRRVLHRPGRVWLAQHRVDVALPLQRADVRIRRAGFDIDPGYVPWLDTVVHFHYT